MSENSKAGTDLAKWSDGFMFKAEESNAAEGPKAFLLGGPSDPLGQIAACAKMYKGEVVRDLRDVTDAERREYLEQIQKTVLKMPLEAVHLHFMIEGVTRAFTHQMVRQRTAAYAQESMRFAVKEDAATAVAMPPSLEGTVGFEELWEMDLAQRLSIGLVNDMDSEDWVYNSREGLREQTLNKGGKQAWRLRWDAAVKSNADDYMALVNSGMPAEDARGLTVHNITTRLNYITNLRSWYDTMAVRVSDQAQFEWRAVAMHMALAMRDYGLANSYERWMDLEEYNSIEDTDLELVRHTGDRVLIRSSSWWQYKALSDELKPIEFKIGKRAFGANFDRPSRIGERVDAFAAMGVPSDRWTEGAPEHNIPAISPDEWLLDPNSARLADGMEFDIFGQRVRKGTAWHWTKYDGKGILYNDSAHGDRQWSNLHDGPSSNVEDVL